MVNGSSVGHKVILASCSAQGRDLWSSLPVGKLSSLKSDQGFHFGKASTVPLDRYHSLVVVTVIIAISVVTMGIVAETARVPRGKLR
jgi:hypothetical protein